MSLLAILSLLKRFWWAPIILGLGITVAIQHGTIARKDDKIAHYGDVMKTNEERVKAATATFKANAEATARRIEQAQSAATQEASGEIETLRGQANAYAAAYIRLRNGKAAGGGAVGPGQIGGSSVATGSANGAGGMSELDDADLQICTTNTVKAISWRAWWAKIMAIPRD